MNKTTREAFVKQVLSVLTHVVAWNQKGPEFFDCSGLVTWALWVLKVCDWRSTHNANALFETFPATANPKPGDLAFWSTVHDGPISHVAVVLGEPKADVMHEQSLVSADGASSRLSLEEAKESSACRVRVHQSVVHTGRNYFRGFRTNTYLE